MGNVRIISQIRSITRHVRTIMATVVAPTAHENCHHRQLHLLPRALNSPLAHQFHQAAFEAEANVQVLQHLTEVLARRCVVSIRVHHIIGMEWAQSS